MDGLTDRKSDYYFKAWLQIPSLLLVEMLFNTNHAMDKPSRRQTDDIFLIFPRKQHLTLYANCLLRECQILFSNKKKRKIFQNVCGNFYPACKALKISCLKNIIAVASHLLWIGPTFGNHVDPDQSASEANWSGPALFVITLECCYNDAPYNAKTVIMWLVCGSHFFVQFFSQVFESFAIFQWNSAIKKIASHDGILADLHILFYQSCHQYFVF